MSDSLYIDLVYERSIDDYLLRTNHEGIKQIRRFRQALLEEKTKNENLSEIVTHMGEDFNKCKKVIDKLEGQSVNLRRTLSISQTSTELAEQEIALHLHAIAKEKRNKKVWRWVALGEALIIGGTIYGIIQLNN